MAVAREICELALSPDGRLLAMTTRRLDDAFCQPMWTLPNLVVIDLATGARRTWTQDDWRQPAGLVIRRRQLRVPVTSGQGEYPPGLAAFQPQGGCRILDVPR